MRPLALAPQSLPTLRPQQFLRCAAQSGFQRVGVRILQGTPPYRPDDHPMAVSGANEIPELRAILDGEGLGVVDLEFVLLDADTPVDAYRPYLEMGATLGARYLVTCSMVPDPAQAAEKLQALCRSASEFELNVAVEFLRYTGVKTIDDAVMLVRASGADNAFVLLDSFHLHQAGHRPEDILAYPASCFPYLQLCDAPGPPNPDSEEVIRQARTERLNPGEGEMDLAGIIRALPLELPISLEVPNLARIAQVGEMAHAIRLRQDAEKLLREIDAP